MITAVGLGTDPTMRHFCESAAQLGAAVEFIDLADVVTGSWEFHLGLDRPSWVSGSTLKIRHLDPHMTYYSRLIDLGSVSPKRNIAWHTLVTAFNSWLELCPGTVVNRPGHPNDNACKPLHETHLARNGFAVPSSFTGSSRSDLIAFVEEGPTIAKALSGQRVDCRIVTVADFAEYDERSGPVHLQRFVAGDDVRAHVVGNELISIRIRSRGPDYRIDADATIHRHTVTEDVATLLRSATASMGLAFAGWDLRLNDDGYWALEANPMPGYSYYDRMVDGRITRALIDYMESHSQRSKIR